MHLFLFLALPRKYQSRASAASAGFRFECESDETIEVATDRKSTRLNSSHSQISYAVFCLKKKKKYERRCTVYSRRNVSSPLLLILSSNLCIIQTFPIRMHG